MIDAGKRNLLGVLIDPVDYDTATNRVVEAAQRHEPFAVSALAVHGVMEAVGDPQLRYQVNKLDLVAPDGQAVRWALNLLHGSGLADRCYGPKLMGRVCEAAAAADLPVYLYGSRDEVLDRLRTNLEARVPGLQVAGTAPSRFRQVTAAELDEIAASVRASGARIVFVGLGCPRQENFVYEMRERIGAPVLAVGAAFDYHAGLLVEPPGWVQRAGLQWLWRLAAEPRRLWRRYLTTNPAFVAGVARQRLGRTLPDPLDAAPPDSGLGYA